MVCDEPGTSPCCSACRALLPWQGCACELCAEPLIEPGICGRCQQRRPAQRAAFAALAYQAPVVQLMTRFKYAADPACGEALVDLLTEGIIRADEPMPEALIAVPLHRNRLRVRGFNPAHSIARGLAKRLDIPLLDRGLRRLRDTPSQVGLSADDRRRNMRRAFVATRPVYGSLALVDDVLTTGSTAAAAAQALKSAGVEAVSVWAVARARQPA